MMNRKGENDRSCGCGLGQDPDFVSSFHYLVLVADETI
jgi:hypothetical protein